MAELKFNQGWSYVKIGKLIGRCDKTVAKMIKKWNAESKDESRTNLNHNLINKHNQPPKLNV